MPLNLCKEKKNRYNPNNASKATVVIAIANSRAFPKGCRFETLNFFARSLILGFIIDSSIKEQQVVQKAFQTRVVLQEKIIVLVTHSSIRISDTLH